MGAFFFNLIVIITLNRYNNFLLIAIFVCEESDQKNIKNINRNQEKIPANCSNKWYRILPPKYLKLIKYRNNDLTNIYKGIVNLCETSKEYNI